MESAQAVIVENAQPVPGRAPGFWDGRALITASLSTSRFPVQIPKIHM